MEVQVRKRVAMLAAFAVLGASAVACVGGNAGTNASMDCGERPNECNAAEVKSGGEITYAIQKNVARWNASAPQDAEVLTMLQPLLPNVFRTYPDLKRHLQTQWVESAEEERDGPQTVVYRIADGARWSDGTPLSVADFVYAWRTQNGKDCPRCAAFSQQGYDQIASVEGSDGGKTVTVVFDTPYLDWQYLFSNLYPAHLAAKHGTLDTAKGLQAAFDYFDSNPPTFSGGPYLVDRWQNNVALTLKRNPKWGGEGPYLDTIVFRIITDSTQLVTALQNDEVQVIYPAPEIDLVHQLEQTQDVETYIGDSQLWEQFTFNLQNEDLADEKLRKAIVTAVDRRALIDKTVGQMREGIEPLDNLMPGQEGIKTDVLTGTGFGTGDVAKAKQILADAGYTTREGKLVSPKGEEVEPLSVRYTTGNQIRKNECELFAQQVKQLGIGAEIKPTNDLTGTLGDGDFDVMRFAWFSNENGVVTWQHTLWHSKGGYNFGGYHNPRVDELLDQAERADTLPKAVEKLNDADALVAKDAYVLPLYLRPSVLAVRGTYGNVRDNPSSSYVTYNVEQWGLKK